MNETVLTAKAFIAAFFAAIGTFLGWKGIMAVVWLILMAMDWITGTAAARKNGTWKSSVSRDGAWHKAGSVIVILLAFIADFIMSVMLPHIPMLNISWPEFLAPLVLAWYIVTELGSILENAVKLGAPVPSWIVKIFDATLKMADSLGDKLVEGLQKPEEITDHEAQQPEEQDPEDQNFTQNE